MITVLHTPLDPADISEFSHTGPFIDFLLQEFPDGFPGPHVTALGLDHLKVEDYDTPIGADDRVVIAIAPGIPAVPALVAVMGFTAYNAAALAINGLLISTVLNFAINKLFGPKGSKPETPSSTDTSGASSTYSLNTPTNVARLGQPIPVAYGRNRIVPDLASTPYKQYKDLNEYVDVLLCLGAGIFEIHDIYVGDTPISQLAQGVVRYKVYPEELHLQQFGVIQNDMAAWYYENMYTSPEVSNNLLDAYDVNEPPKEPSEAFTGTITNDNTHNEGTFKLDSPAYDWTNTGNKEMWAEVTNATFGTLVFKLQYFGYDPNDPASFATYGILDDPRTFPGITGTEGASIRLHFSSDFSQPSAPVYLSVGPYYCGGSEVKTSTVFCDFVFPNGLFDVSAENGMALPHRVNISVLLDSIDDLGNSTGNYFRSISILANDKSTLRFTYGWEVPYSRYRVTATRTSAKPVIAGAQADVYWTGLRCVLPNAFGNPTYGPVTLIALEMKASEGLSSDVLNRISVDCTRAVPNLDGVLIPRRDPVSAFVDAFTNTSYGGRRPKAELDLDRMAQLESEWAGRYFDAVFDQPVTLWEAMGLIVQMQHAAPTILGSVVSIVEDKNHSVGTLAFSQDNIKELTLTFLFSDGDEPDGVEGEYRDPDDNSALYAMYPSTAVNPESIVLWGCRDANQAMAFVTQRWKQLVYRRRLIKLETEMEGHVLSVGDAVTVEHPLLGPERVLCVVQSVSPQEEFSCSIELHVHQPEVFL